jgi:hypothetical protein
MQCPNLLFLCKKEEEEEGDVMSSANLRQKPSNLMVLCALPYEKNQSSNSPPHYCYNFQIK